MMVKRIFITAILAMFLHSQTIAAESSMEPIPQAKNLITEIWCVEGFKVFYVEKTTNETFQFFQLTRNGGMAPKLMECDGSEVRKVE